MKPLPLVAGAVCTAIGLLASNMTLASSSAGFELTMLAMDTAPVVTPDDGSYEIARRGRGRGRGGDRDRDDDRSRDRDRDDDRSSGRSRPRIPGGSGCDDPGDLAEHPECRGEAPAGGGAPSGNPRFDDGNGHGGRPRVPGGSGCDDPGDVLEHAECRV